LSGNTSCPWGTFHVSIFHCMAFHGQIVSDCL
jgi:hypothetical protein